MGVNSGASANGNLLLMISRWWKTDTEIWAIRSCACVFCACVNAGLSAADLLWGHEMVGAYVAHIPLSSGLFFRLVVAGDAFAIRL